MRLPFFINMLEHDSTSGSEREFALWLRDEISARFHCNIETLEVGDGTLNLLCTWGEHPQVCYCTHLDTVPPYIAPTVVAEDGDTVIKGRGSCDAKGQIMAILKCLEQLEKQGATNQALLLVSGEETGSYGAKAFNATGWGCDTLVVCEPTEGCQVAASKGTAAFQVNIEGKSCHSGYPDHGHSAIDTFVDLVNHLRSVQWAVDPVMGPTTWNVGKLASDNPQNVLSPSLSCRIYFRTTAASAQQVAQVMQALAGHDGITIEALGGDTPMSWHTLPGLPTTTVAFGSDAPQLHHFAHRMIMGAGSIMVAHQPTEEVRWCQIEAMSERLVEVYWATLKKC